MDAVEFRGLIGDYLTDNLGFGKGKRLELNEAVLEKTRSFRCEPLWASWELMVGTSFMKCWIVCTPRSQNVSRLSRKVWSLEGVVLRVDIKLDPGFSQFYDWTLEHSIPVVVLSSGMEPIIRALLAKLIGPKADAIPIVSNNVDIAPDGTWKIVYRDESRIPPQTPCLGDADGGDFGHDKSRAIRPYAALPADNRPILVYCGDGVSDISAARETDLLFAKKGRDLIKHCIIERVPFYPFDVQHPPLGCSGLMADV